MPEMPTLKRFALILLPALFISNSIFAQDTPEAPVSSSAETSPQAVQSEEPAPDFIISGQLKDNGRYPRPFIRADIMIITDSTIDAITVNGETFSPIRQTDFYLLNYVFNLSEGANQIRISAATSGGKQISREYTVYYPEKNDDVYRARAFYPSVFGGVFYDTNPRYVSDKDLPESRTIGDQNKSGDFFRVMGFQGIYFYARDLLMTYLFKDIKYFDQSKNKTADYFSHDLTMTRKNVPDDPRAFRTRLDVRFRSLNIEREGFANEFSIAGGLEQVLNVSATGTENFYGLDLRAAVKYFYDGERKTVYPAYLEYSRGFRSEYDSFLAAVRVKAGRNSEGLKNSEYNYLAATLNYRQGFAESWRFTGSLSAELAEYDTDRYTEDDISSDTITRNRSDISYLIESALIYSYKAYEFELSAKHKSVDSNSRPYSKTVAGLQRACNAAGLYQSGGTDKKTAAKVNAGLGLLDAKKADAIIKIADEIIAGRHADQFPIDIFQTGSGTSTNMNVNEVIAVLASRQAGRRSVRMMTSICHRAVMT
ncbi:hypothetical protein CHS0354_018378 [Potamilus streckersoni]|uniref:Fumarate lyase N-terminal domain-containing protein n=1 Tax=Potamilus streckersoni TaxID=2493646 RepID=A0AAE0TBG7_9BIVA|nr:hypothetical protein CHS0354_018378 [Potamilus streckersoni]